MPINGHFGNRTNGSLNLRYCSDFWKVLTENGSFNECKDKDAPSFKCFPVFVLVLSWELLQDSQNFLSYLVSFQHLITAFIPLFFHVVFPLNFIEYMIPNNSLICVFFSVRQSSWWLKINVSLSLRSTNTQESPLSLPCGAINTSETLPDFFFSCLPLNKCFCRTLF